MNENSLHAAFPSYHYLKVVVCLLFERIANDLVNDTQVYLLFTAFIR